MSTNLNEVETFLYKAVETFYPMQLNYILNWFFSATNLTYKQIRFRWTDLTTFSINYHILKRKEKMCLSLTNKYFSHWHLLV